MKIDSCVTDLDKLQDWWKFCQAKDEPRPYFTVYRGPEAKLDRVVFRNTEIDDPDEAWNALRSLMEMHTEHGGIFRIYVTSKPGHNMGYNTLYKVNNPFAPAWPGQNPTIGGMQSAGMFGIYGNPKEMIAAEVARERKFWELEQRIKDLQTEQEAKVGEVDALLGEFMPIVKDLAHRFGLKMMGYGPAQAPPQPSPEITGNHTPDEIQEGYDYDRLEPALDQLRQVTPDVEESIVRLAAWAKANPDMARGLLQNIAE